VRKVDRKVLSCSERASGSERNRKDFHKSDKVVIIFERPPWICDA
jgi:hypothetical protein